LVRSFGDVLTEEFKLIETAIFFGNENINLKYPLNQERYANR